jgi:pantoate--beta-alanine ligase
VLSVRSVPELRDGLRPPRRAGARIGLVPTMGALHDGHRSLLRRARADSDTVVMSLFVNPRQFTDIGDLAGYPRDETRDLALAAAEGVDVVFAPAPEAVYPAGFATTVSVGGPARGLEGEHRGRAHFDGVATVVAKLLGMVGPEVAYFGQKDAQQVAVIRRLVADLDIPCAIEVCPTVRESDGLAMSSRNAQLSPEERVRAGALFAALRSVREAVRDGVGAAAEATAGGRGLLAAAGAELEYLELVDPTTMVPLARLTGSDGAPDGNALAVVAARVGAVRLIDNLIVSVPSPRPHPDHLVATPSGAPT